MQPAGGRLLILMRHLDIRFASVKGVFIDSQRQQRSQKKMLGAQKNGSSKKTIRRSMFYDAPGVSQKVLVGDFRTAHTRRGLQINRLCR